MNINSIEKKLKTNMFQLIIILVGVIIYIVGFMLNGNKILAIDIGSALANLGLYISVIVSL
jgi:hypothetical protein